MGGMSPAYTNPVTLPYPTLPYLPTNAGLIQAPNPPSSSTPEPPFSPKIDLPYFGFLPQQQQAIKTRPSPVTF